MMTKTWFCEECGAIPGEQVHQFDDDRVYECAVCGNYVTLNITPWPTEWERKFEAWLLGLLEQWENHQDHTAESASSTWTALHNGQEILWPVIEASEEDDDE